GAGLTGLVEGAADGVLVVGGDHDDVRALLRQRVDVAHLRGRARLRRAGLAVDALELLDRDLAALVVGGVEVRVVHLLRQERDLQALLDGGTTRGCRGRAAGAAVVGTRRDGEGQRRE